MTSILLQNGTVLCHELDDRVKAAPKTDILIQGGKIAKMGKSLAGDHSTTVIDCSSKIVSPGLIDTHHHVWQTQLKGRHSEDQLLEYMVRGNMQSYNYTPSDIYWGELGGCLEAIDAGTTMIVDHAHLTCSPEHASQAVAATTSSGIRSCFCYTPLLRIKSWTDSIEPEADLLPPWFYEQLEHLAKDQPFGEGRVHLGLGFDFVFLPKDVVVGLFKKVRAAGVKLITVHLSQNAVTGIQTQKLQGWVSNLQAIGKNTSTVQLLDSYGLLGPDVLFSHALGISQKDVEILKEKSCYISCTPDTEAQMVGTPQAFRKDFLVSLGIDCHSNNRSSILDQMRLALFSARLLSNDKLWSQGLFPKRIKGTAEEAFNLGTIHGARAVGMEDKIGSLAEGKLADIVIINTETPTMICAAVHDPVVAVARFASVRDIDTVIVDGIIRKQGGYLLPVTADEGSAVAAGSEIKWEDVARQLVQSRKAVQEKVEKASSDAAMGLLKGMMQVDDNDLVDVEE